MPDPEEIKASLGGALRLARLDASGIEAFDLSVEGFWGSFFAAVLAIPAYLILMTDAYGSRGMPADLGSILAIETLAYLASWTVFPLAALPITRLLGLGGRYVPLVVANNWGTLLQMAVLVTALLLAAFLPFDIRTPLVMSALLLCLIYQWFVIRSALQAGGVVALGLVVVDLLLSRLIDMGAERLAGG